MSRMSDSITPDEARIQIVVEEAAAQNAALLRKVADLRVSVLQLEQEVNRLARKLQEATKDTADEETDSPTG